jgi:hypothetical protein
MADRTRLSQRIQEYPPSKTVLFWSCAACVAATMVVGFAWGGWVTGGTAEDMVADAAEQARAETAAAVCVEEFMRQADAGVQLASLKEISSSWRRENFVEEGGWAMIADQEYDDAADLCAERLMTMEAPSTQEASSIDAGTVAQ